MNMIPVLLKMPKGSEQRSEKWNQSIHLARLCLRSVIDPQSDSLAIFWQCVLCKRSGNYILRFVLRKAAVITDYKLDRSFSHMNLDDYDCFCLITVIYGRETVDCICNRIAFHSKSAQEVVTLRTTFSLQSQHNVCTFTQFYFLCF